MIEGSLGRRLAHASALRAERAVDAVRRWFPNRSGDVFLHPYIGHGNSESIVLRGRALADPPMDVAAPDGSLWRRALNTFNRFESDEVPGLEIAIELDGERTTVVTDEEGYYEARLPSAGSGIWRTGIASAAGASAEIAAVVPDAVEGALLIISDIDDTVLETGAQRFWQMARATVFGTFRTRTPVPAMAEFYRGLVRGAAGEMENVTFYVSSSPWNLYDVLIAFLEYRGLPRGPVFLRDLGIDESKLISTGHGRHKSAAIDEILDTHADHRAILVGDTGQHDPEIYSAVARQRPDRVAAIYLRDVAGSEREGQVDEMARELSGLGVPLVRAANAEAFAEHAREMGHLAAHDLAAVRLSLSRGLD